MPNTMELSVLMVQPSSSVHINPFGIGGLPSILTDYTKIILSSTTKILLPQNNILISQSILCCGNVVKSPHTCNDNHIQSLESQVNLCMYGVIVLPKVVDFCFDRI